MQQAHEQVQVVFAAVEDQAASGKELEAYWKDRFGTDLADLAWMGDQEDDCPGQVHRSQLHIETVACHLAAEEACQSSEVEEPLAFADSSCVAVFVEAAVD